VIINCEKLVVFYLLVTIDKYYVGYTNDIVRRLSEPNRIKGKFTDKGIPWELVYKESYADKVSAENREIEIKRKKSRKYIESLLLSAT